MIKGKLDWTHKGVSIKDIRKKDFKYILTIDGENNFDILTNLLFFSNKCTHPN